MFCIGSDDDDENDEDDEDDEDTDDDTCKELIGLTYGCFFL